MTTYRDICCRADTDLPFVSIILGVAALLLFLLGENVSFLQYDRSAIAYGEVWRCITGHWIHWSFDHFLWCTITVVALGCICERLSRKGYIATLATASCIIPGVIWFTDAEMQMYRGLSGLASGVFVFAAVMMMRRTYLEKDWLGVILSAVAGLGYIGKILFEYASGSTLFVNSHEVFSPVPLAHLSGGIVGLVMAVIFSRKRSGQLFIHFQSMRKI